MKKFLYPLLSILSIFVYKIIETICVRGFIGKSTIFESMILYQEYVMIKVFGILLLLSIVMGIEAYFEITIKIKRKFIK